MLERLLALSIAVIGVSWVVRRWDADKFEKFGLVDDDARAAMSAKLRQPHTQGSVVAGMPRSERAQRALESIDEAGTGVVSLAEVTTPMRLAGANPSDAEGEAYRMRLRAAGMKAITAEALEAVLEQWETEHPAVRERSELRDAFDVMDTNHDGVVVGEEMTGLEPFPQFKAARPCYLADLLEVPGSATEWS